MKTLKRTLCLVLVLCMMVGALAISGSAAFTDEADIQYTEAVGVMSGMGIISGYTDGSFGPKDTITRAQVAKLIYAAMTGETGANAADAYKSANTFKDVTSDKWYAGFVNYIAERGIIVGYGNGNFGPEDKVTTYQVLVMVLRALGYDSEAGGKEITNASNWKIAATSKAGELKITKNLVGTDKPSDSKATREAACEIIYRAFMNNNVKWNALANDYVAGNIWDNNNNGVSYLMANYGYAGAPAAPVQVTAAAPDSKNVVMATDGTVSFAVDSIEAVGHYFNVYVGNKVFYAEQVSTRIATPKTNGTVDYSKYDTTGTAIYTKNYAVDASTNSGNANTVVVLPTVGAAKDKIVAYDLTTISRGDFSISYRNSTKTYTVSGNGGSFSSAANATGNNIISGVDFLSYVDTTKDNAKVVKFNFFTSGGKVYVSEIETVTGKVQFTNTAAKTVTVGGKTYSASALESGSVTLDKLTFDGEYKFYIDANDGSVYRIETLKDGNQSAANSQLVQVLAQTSVQSGSDIFATVTMVKIVTAEGKIEVVELNAATGALASVANSSVYNAVIADGKATFTALATGVESKSATLVGDDFKNNTATVAGTAYYIGANSAFVYIKDNATATLKTGKHAGSATGSATVVVSSGAIVAAFIGADFSASAPAVDKANLYYVTKFVGQSANGYEYEAYSLSTGAAQTVVSKTATAGLGLYSLSEGTLVVVTGDAYKTVSPAVAVEAAGSMFLTGTDVATSSALAVTPISATCLFINVSGNDPIATANTIAEIGNPVAPATRTDTVLAVIDNGAVVAIILTASVA